MKTIYFVDEAIDRIGGVERIVNTLANHFALDNKVKIISLYKTRDNEFFSYNDNIEIEYILDFRKVRQTKNKTINKLRSVCSHFIIKQKLKKRLKQLNENDVVVIGRVRVAWKYVELFKKSKKIIVRDAIHLMNCKKYERIVMQKKFHKYVTNFIVSSTESKRAYDNFFKHKVNMTKVYNPLGITPKSNYNVDSRVMMAIGRNDIQKAYNVLLKAFKLFVEENKSWKLELVGDFKEGDDIFIQINELGLQEYVIISPPTKDVVAKLAEAGVYLMTSRYEGYANSLVEAVACGVPAITVDWLMGAEEIINNNYNGIIVGLKNRVEYAYKNAQNEDILNLSKAMLSLASDDEMRLKMSNNGPKIIESRKLENIVKVWEKIITN